MGANRIVILQRLILGALALIWLGLCWIQVWNGPTYLKKAERNRTRLIHLPAVRGAILDRWGIPLAEDRLHFELAILPQEFKEADAIWRRISRWVGIPPSELVRRYRKGFSAHFAPVTIVRDLSMEQAFRLEEERFRLPGVVVRPVPRRHYPLGPAVGSVVGYLGRIAQEELTRLKPYGYTPQDWIGKDGLEKQYDAILRGKDGGLQIEVDARGRMVQQIGFLPPQRGKDIRVCVDGRIQALCHRLMEGATGGMVVMDVATGEILALVSSPGFDPNAFVDSNRTEEVQRFLQDPDRPLFNRAIRAVVPPGSTFKPVVAYWALAENKIAPYTAFLCTGEYRLGQGLFQCWLSEGHGDQTVVQALEHSCNVFFYQVGRRLKADGIASAARLFRLDRRTQVDLPWESQGLVPDPVWMKRTQHHPWQEGDTVSFAIGQSALQVTPIEMLILFSAIATGGICPTPHLVRPIAVDAEPNADLSESHRIPLDPKALEWVRKGLEAVVESETGTGRLARVPGIRVAGKTGTAQVPKGEPHAWFCGYVPADRPKIAFVIFLEHGGKGGLRPAQIAGQLVVHLKEMQYI